MTVRLGLLAASRIAQPAVVEPVAAVEGVEVTAVAARDASRAGAAAERWGIPHAYGSYAELVRSPEIDAVYIATPAALHREWAVAAIQEGKHVLCEKPLAANADDAREIADAAAASDRVVMEAYHWRYHPFADAIRDVLDSGVLGPPSRVEARFLIPEGFIPRDDIRWDMALGGGALMDLGCYPVQWVRFTLGPDVEVVSATAECAVPGIDAALKAELRWPSGATGSIEASMVHDGASVVADLVVRGEHGTMTAHNPLAPQSGARLVVETAAGRTDTVPETTATYHHQLVAFRDAVEHGALFPTTAVDGVATMQVIDDCYRAAGLPVRPRWP